MPGLWSIIKLAIRIIHIMLICLKFITQLFGFFQVIKTNSDKRLHQAVKWDNKTIARQLIKLGHRIDRLGDDGKTPLMIAVEHNSFDCVKVLLKAGANMNIVNASGKSALQMIYESESFKQKIIEAFHDRLKRQTSNVEELIDQVIGAGGKLCHAVFFKDTEIMESMLRRGIDVNSRGPSGMTALHVASKIGAINLVKWLTTNGADVNAINESNGMGALHYAARIGNKDIVKNLLEHGADVNLEEPFIGSTPLFDAILLSKKRNEYTECIEILLKFGAIPRNPSIVNICPIFDFLLLSSNFQIIDMLVGHLAILERSDESIPESVMYCYDISRGHRKAFRKVRKDYKRCQHALTIVVCENLTLFDLLLESDEKIKIYLIRKRQFRSKVEHFCNKHKLDELYPYYYKKLMKSIARADCLRKLEETAISVVCGLIDGNYNQCYIFARKVIDYLDKSDLVRLSQMKN